MFNILYQYLIQQKSLSLPGLGTLQLQHIPAISNFSDHIIEPPAQKVTFDDMYDSPNKNLFQYVSAQLKIEEWEAIKKINDFSFDLKNELKHGNEIIWDKVGVLKADLSGAVLLDNRTITYDYIQSVAAKRIIRTNTSHTILRGDREVSESFLQSPATGVVADVAADYRQRKKWLLWSLVFVVIALSILVIHFYTRGTGIHSLFNIQKISPKEAPAIYK
ncbi:MAG: hypothetical protein KF862_05740 [Chitinophagaceae bacterium]|nr:hypothetical protein [Chitinophagaceae bacterium]